MRKILTSLFLMLVAMTVMAQEGRKYGEAEQYRRSSLSLILISHGGKKYASQIEQQFYQIVPPERYNEHRISIRVIPATSKNMSSKKIEELLRRKGVAKELVSTWFNRSYSTGVCNMDLIQERGLYNASKEDNDVAQMTQRKDAMLKDAGEELIQNTFVLVCDLTYHDKQKRNRIFSYMAQGLMYAGAAVADTYARKQGNSSWSYIGQNARDIGDLSQAAIEDIAGFEVDVHSYLYRLDWNKDLSDKMYSSYWVDASTSAAEAEQHRQAFDNDQESFTLSYIGDYRSRAGRRASASTSDLNLVIRDVCENAVNKSVEKLAKMYTVFKPKAPFYCGDDGKYYAYIGTKEGVNSKSKYEVIEPKLNKKGELSYNRKAVLRTTYANIWKNEGTYITQNGEEENRGTAFYHDKGSRDICGKGYLMREMGKMGYQYKKHQFYVDIFMGKANVPSSEKEEMVEEVTSSYELNRSKGQCSPTIYGFNFGWIYNFHTNIAWDVLGVNLGGGSKDHEWYSRYSSIARNDNEGYMLATITTGIVLRTSPWGRKKRFSLYLWPQVGFGLNRIRVAYSYQKKHTLGSYKGYTYDTEWKGGEEVEKKNCFDWNIRAGMNITDHFYIGYNYGHYRQNICIGYKF